MDVFYDHLGFLPETMQPTIAALLIIIVGYFLSKIFAAIVSSIIPPNPDSTEIVIEEILPIRTRVIRACFWVCWLIFIVIGLNQLPSISISLPQNPPSPETWMNILLMAFYAYVLLLSEKYIAKLYKAFARFGRSIPLPRDNPVFRYIIRNSWLPILIIVGIALAIPETLGHKVAITVIVLFAGWLLGNVTKQAIESTFQNKFLTKFSFYFIIVHVLFAVIGIWV